MVSIVSLRLQAGGGFLDFNFYPALTEEKADSVFTLNAFSKLPGRFHYFSLTNVINAEQGRAFSGHYDFYTEQNLRWAIREDLPWDLTTQLNLRSGSDNDRLRFGARWRLNDAKPFEEFFDAIHLVYAINFHLVQFDHEDAYVWQMEHSFRKTFPEISDRLYLAGFADHTFNQDLPVGTPRSPIVGEAQLGWRLSGDWNLVAEYRINEYRRSAPSNVGIGIQYIYSW